MKHAISRERLTLNKNTISMLSTLNEDKRNHVQGFVVTGNTNDTTKTCLACNSAMPNDCETSGFIFAV